MTTLFKREIKCGLCGSEHDYTVIGSTNAFGFPDLDTRPPEMERSTIFAWVQRCPDCGYCAADLSKALPAASSVVNSAEYQKQLNDRSFPVKAASFLCKAMIDRETGDYAAAAWAQIRAAWVCDDASRHREAVECRRKAAEMLTFAEQHGQPISDQAGAGTAILVDLLRRSEQFAQALRTIDLKRHETDGDVISRILEYQSALINKGDVDRHTIAEAFDMQSEQGNGPAT